VILLVTWILLSDQLKPPLESCDMVETYTTAVTEAYIPSAAGVFFSATHSESGLAGGSRTITGHSVAVTMVITIANVDSTPTQSGNSFTDTSGPTASLYRSRVLRARSPPEPGATRATRGMLAHLFPEFGEFSGSDVDAALNRRRQSFVSG
jgi:hypothetical protein